jgi:hypothetical protein
MADTDLYETWEHLAPGITWINTTNERGAVKSHKLAGPGRRLRLKIVDRVAIEDEHPNNNPFINGRMARVREDGTLESGDGNPKARSDEQLLGLLQLGDEFEHFLEQETELNIRRLRDLAESPGVAKEITLGQFLTIKAVIERRWPTELPPSAMSEWMIEL